MFLKYLQNNNLINIHYFNLDLNKDYLKCFFYVKSFIKFSDKLCSYFYSYYFIYNKNVQFLIGLKNRYPDYQFIGDIEISKSAQLSSRYTKASLLGVVTDIHMLSKCDYIVCTFSSQVSHC